MCIRDRVVGMLTCIMVGFVLKPQLIVNEIELNGPFKMKKFYSCLLYTSRCV